ncbi:phosphate ABC transporter substrate-binding protein PstS [Streptomyces xiamenensis]|jgi:phosphate transport system substrate-binding protein|uniref:phosphate ABC transporter substrate-binding protein PstS n=1 Tax=Streptomyces xiamenensis TaxID=408015 RepID=UPI0036E56B53
MRNWRAKTAAIVAVSALALTACGGSDDNGGDKGGDDKGTGGGSSLSGTVTGAGASFPATVFQDWIAAYQGDKSGVTVNYQSVGSGTGVEQFIGQSIDFGSSEEYLSDEALADAEAARGCPAVQFPVVFGSVAIAFNDPALDGLVLSPEVIASIYDREITNFNDPAIADLNPDFDLPDQDILPVHRSDSSGTTFVFSHYLNTEVPAWADTYGEGKEIEWSGDTIGGEGNEGVSQQISQNPGGVGYVNQSYALELGLPTAKVINADGEAIAPTLEATTAASEEAEIPDTFQFTINGVGGEGYPIAGTNFILAYTCGYDDATADIIKDFWSWTLTEDADALALELGYAPLGADLKERVQAQIDLINSQG